ncbi:Gfo/Idh/MocA family oxidoreductase [Paenibacillus albiflavus]|uniref:Gfo/Idh/MocA family oxidoreductase n=1 Tax=Paenibacillus albiflavus TaxID=2545760 RepID=A0A4R4E979_9BACL|nr:Gfo/Idh/MocA family oxidoreductase [Paenibacillus albiflavus]TCZ75440.1 Gfo/Idh/MocA family oxidoreductase [Paenibacillus albiflavus]
MVRFGVIGTNQITDEFIKGAREAEGFELAAVYSRTEERAQEFQAKHDIPHIFTNLKEMAQSDVIDAVYIASPNSFHAEQAILCMNHGKHVLCEKPMASNRHELAAMIEAAKNNGVLLMEALKSTKLPNFHSIQDNLHKIGKVRRYFASFCQYSSRYDAYKEGKILNAFNPALSNGSLMDIGVYCIYPLVVLFGKPDELHATGLLLDSGVDGEGSLLLKYKEMDAVIMHSKVSNSYLPSEIQGEKGNILIDKISRMSKVTVHYKDDTTEDISRPQSINSMYHEVQAFINLVNSGKTESSTNSFLNSMITMEIMDEARRQIGLVYEADRIQE